MGAGQDVLRPLFYFLVLFLYFQELHFKYKC